MTGKLWIRLILRHKIDRDLTLLCDRDAWEDTLRDACRALDVSVPVVLPRHLKDWALYGQMHFAPGDFMDAVPFDRMEIEYFEEGKQRGMSDDPRNA